MEGDATGDNLMAGGEERGAPGGPPRDGRDREGEAGSAPRGHLGVTWGVYLCAGKPPLPDIILSHPPDLTRCDSVIGLAIPAMSGHIQNRGAASGDLYIGISGINRVLLSKCFRNFSAFRSDGQCIGDCQLARDFALTDILADIPLKGQISSAKGSLLPQFSK